MITPALLVVSFLGALGEGALAQGSGPETGRNIAIRDTQSVGATYVGSQDAVQALDSGKAQPLSLARGDFNQDGVSDLLAGYAAPDGTGLLALYLGNLDAFAPRSYQSWVAIGQGRFPAPFLSMATVVQIPRPPDFLAAGSFTGTDHTDVVTAARGDRTLYLLAGDGLGSLETVQAITLPGPVTATVAGRFGPSNPNPAVIVGIGGQQPAALVYSSSAQGLSLMASYALPRPATTVVIDDMDGDGLPDVVIISGGGISILHATGSSGRPELEPLPLPISAVTLITGYFVHDRAWRRQIAVLDQAGAIDIVAHRDFDSRGWTKAEAKSMRDAMLHRRPNPFARAESGPVRDGWRIVETIPGIAPSGGTTHPLLLSSRISGGATDDVLVLDSGAGQIAVATHPWVKAGANSFTPANVANRTYSAGAPVAVLLFPVNVDAREGLVLLHQGQTGISVMMPIPGPRSTQSSKPATSSDIDGPQPSAIPVSDLTTKHREGQ